MIGTATSTLKELKEKERKEREAIERQKCEEYATRKAGDASKLVEFSNKYKGLWYLPAFDDQDNIEMMLVLKPINRNILSLASTKLEDGGLYVFLETAMRECIIEDLSDMDMMEIEDYFIPAAMQFQKIMEGKRVSMVKR
jgi:hypothetical protein